MYKLNVKENSAEDIYKLIQVYKFTAMKAHLP